MTEKTTILGTLVIDNIGGTYTKRNYRARMFKKGMTMADINAGHGQIREGQVLGHRAIAEPVQNLVLKSLLSMGYKV